MGSVSLELTSVGGVSISVGAFACAEARAYGGREVHSAAAPTRLGAGFHTRG